MAKFKLENFREGIIVCRVLEPLNQAEAAQIIKGIEKVLANGKARIILDFTSEAAKGEADPDFFEKSMRPLKNLAKKMRGDLLYVVPEPEGQKVFGAISDLKAAINNILGQGDTGKDKSELIQEIENLKYANKKLQNENKFLTEKVEELVKVVSEPSTNEEMKAGLDHYKNLAKEQELAPPTQPGKPEKKSDNPK